jgi:predicted AlkP superfamily pyrophosphatase or phosphodiesterase
VIFKRSNDTFSRVTRQPLIFLSVLLISARLWAAPKLVVVVVVDQLRADYLDPSRAYTSGFKRLREEGAVFTQCHYSHIPTETALGHATILTGAPPALTGIVSNEWVDRSTGKKVYCVENSAGEKTPERLMVPTLGDLIKEKDPKSRVAAVAGKDRSAILLAGQKADAAIWYDVWRQHFYSSPFYKADVPAKSMQLGRDGDRIVLEMAKTLVRQYKLGHDDHPDILAISFSATDFTGHRNGIGGEDMKENLANVDRVIGELLLFLQGRADEGSRPEVLPG